MRQLRLASSGEPPRPQVGRAAAALRRAAVAGVRQQHPVAAQRDAARPDRRLPRRRRAPGPDRALPAGDDSALRAAAADHPAEADAALERALGCASCSSGCCRRWPPARLPRRPISRPSTRLSGGALGTLAVEPRGRRVPARLGRGRRGGRLDVPAWEVARDARELLLDPEALARLKQCPARSAAGCSWTRAGTARAAGAITAEAVRQPRAGEEPLPAPARQGLSGWERTPRPGGRAAATGPS